MKFKKLLIAFLAGAMLFAMLPLNVLAEAVTYYPSVQLSFTRTSSTEGILTVTPTSYVPGYFVYTASTSSNAVPTTYVEIFYDPVYIELEDLPRSSNYYITYYTQAYYLYGNYQSSTQRYLISPGTGSGSVSGSAVSVISSARSGSNVAITLNVNRSCTVYFSSSSNMSNATSYTFISTGIVPITLSDFSSNIVYYQTVATDLTVSDVGYFIVGSTGSGTGTSSYPILSSYSLTQSNDGRIIFSYTSDRSGNLHFVISTTSISSIDTASAYSVAINSGSGSFEIPAYLFYYSGTNAKMYFVTADGYGNKSSVRSIAVGSTSSTSGYPNLTNCSVVLTSASTATFTCTSDKAGVIVYLVSTTSPGTTSFTPTGYAPLTTGSNSFTISSNYLTASDAKIYFYTMINPTTYDSSSLSYIQPNTSTVYPVNDATSTISSVEIKNVVEPAVGANPSTTYTNSDNRFSVSSVEWQNATLSNTKLRNNDIFQPGYKYSVVLTLDAKSGYSFPVNYSQFSAKINGKNATWDKYTTNSVTIKYTFDTLTAAEIKSVGVNNLTDPVAGQAPDTTGTPGDSSYHIGSINWNPTTTQFKAGASYTVEITLVPANGYKFNVESAKIGYRNAKIESKSADKVVISYNYWVNPFIDIREYDVEPTPGNPNGVPNRYYVFIKYCYLNKLFYGISDTTFAPDATMTRAMFVTVLGRLAGVDVASYKTDKFKDVDQKAWYAPYVAWATQNNIVQGYPDGNFGPDDPVTREQMCELIRRYAVYANIPLKYTERAIAFTDASKISDYAKAAVSIFEQAGVALPRPNKTDFDPKENAMRKEIAEMLILFMMKYMND